MSEKYGAILIRGFIGMKKDVKDTLKMLNLNRTNTLVVLDVDPIRKGMLEKVKDYITYGELDSETLKKLAEKDKDAKVFRLHPPRGGFVSVKKPFTKKGDLGYRGKEINKLVGKMI